MATIKIKGFRLIRWTPGKVAKINLPNGQIDYSPQTKYKHEKKNAFDPTHIHRRGKYHEDTFEFSAVLQPEEYHALLAHLKADGAHYVEFNSTPSHFQQFPITIEKLPKRPDDLCEYPDKVAFTAKSTYTTTPQYIDFSAAVILANDDEIISAQ